MMLVSCMGTDPQSLNWDQIINSAICPFWRFSSTRLQLRKDALAADEECKLHIRRIDRPSKKWLCDIVKCISDAPTPGVDFILHGSQADSTATPFSDIDIVALVNDERIMSAKDVYSVRKVSKKIIRTIYQVDPTAHHGLMVLRKSFLSDYDESFLPIDAIARGLVLGAPDLEVSYKKNLNASISGARLKLDNGIGYFSKRLDRDVSYFNIKNLVSSVLILCVLWVQARMRIFTDKRESLLLFSKIGPSRCMNTLQIATSLRFDWPEIEVALADRVAYKAICSIGFHPQTAQKVCHNMRALEIDHNVLVGFRELLGTIPDFVRGLKSA